MPIIACPTTVVAAPVERVWELIVSPTNLAEWTRTKLLTAPDRPLQSGDRAVYAAGPGLRAIFDVLEVVPPHTFRVDVSMSFGIVNHEVIQLSKLDEKRCRVTFN
jgi:uncharacterized protein YndB with AHSA1/START domain